jgi:hypothetical protein
MGFASNCSSSASNTSVFLLALMATTWITTFWVLQEFWWFYLAPSLLYLFHRYVSVSPSLSGTHTNTQTHLSVTHTHTHTQTYYPQYKWTKAGKAIPLQALKRSQVSRRLRLLDFKTIGTWKWQGCQPYVPAAFTPREIFLVLISVTE